MAEFCLECLNKISDTHYKPRHVKFFSGVDLCEECGEYKKCVARINILGELSDLRQARKEYKEEYGKSYFPSKGKIRKFREHK